MHRCERKGIVRRAQSGRLLELYAKFGTQIKEHFVRVLNQRKFARVRNDVIDNWVPLFHNNMHVVIQLRNRSFAHIAVVVIKEHFVRNVGPDETESTEVRSRAE